MRYIACILIPKPKPTQNTCNRLVSLYDLWVSDYQVTPTTELITDIVDILLVL